MGPVNAVPQVHVSLSRSLRACTLVQSLFPTIASTLCILMHSSGFDRIFSSLFPSFSASNGPRNHCPWSLRFLIFNESTEKPFIYSRNAELPFASYSVSPPCDSAFSYRRRLEFFQFLEHLHSSNAQFSLRNRLLCVGNVDTRPKNAEGETQRAKSAFGEGEIRLVRAATREERPNKKATTLYRWILRGSGVRGKGEVGKGERRTSSSK